MNPIDESEYETANHFGYLFEKDRTSEQNDIDFVFKAEMPPFRVFGNEDPSVKKVTLWDFSKQANAGNHFPVFRQITGSCVGNGGGQAVWYLSAVEVVRLKDPEQVLLPFYLLPYGRSRHYGGLRGRGEGSFGSAFAKAITVDGIVPFDAQGLPQPDMRDGITWGRNVELEWSDGARISDEWLTKSRRHLVKSAAQVRSADAVAQALRNYYPVTIASDWGGMMSPPTRGTPAVRLNTRVTTWHHQMCVIGWWEHPQLGELFYVLNSWGPRAHGQPSSDEPAGGFWINKQDMDYIAKQGESFAFSQFNGFPAQRFSWLI